MDTCSAVGVVITFVFLAASEILGMTDPEKVKANSILQLVANGIVKLMKTGGVDLERQPIS